jgi:hypothetical protein
MEKEKAKSPTLHPNPSWSSTNYLKPAVEIPPVYRDQLEYQDFSKRI